MSNDTHNSPSTDELIRRPGNPDHFMIIEPIEGQATVCLGDTILAQSNRALWVRESASRTFPPLVYFPPEDVQDHVLVPQSKTTRCPLKGTASYFDVIVGSQKSEQAAWSYQQILDFDPRLQRIKGFISFDQNQVQLKVAT